MDAGDYKQFFSKQKAALARFESMVSELLELLKPTTSMNVSETESSRLADHESKSKRLIELYIQMQAYF